MKREKLEEIDGRKMSSLGKRHEFPDSRITVMWKSGKIKIDPLSQTPE